MFTKALAPFVNVRTRAKGLQYFSSGRVIDITGAEWVANAVVRGTRDYRVELVRDRNRFTGSCEFGPRAIGGLIGHSSVTAEPGGVVS